MTIYSDAIDKLMSYFSAEASVAEVSAAKKDFYKSAGIFDEESEDLEMKIRLFTEWFLFTRKLDKEKLTPIELVSSGSLKEFNAEDIEVYKVLADNRHSLFEFIKVKGEDVHIKDLFSDYKMILKKSPVVLGFDKEEIFEARLFPHEDSFVFSQAFCIHPKEANKFIKKEIKAVKKLAEEEYDKGRRELIMRLLRMRYKIDQYRHVNLNQIYSNESKLGI